MPKSEKSSSLSNFRFSPFTHSNFIQKNAQNITLDKLLQESESILGEPQIEWIVTTVKVESENVPVLIVDAESFKQVSLKQLGVKERLPEFQIEIDKVKIRVYSAIQHSINLTPQMQLLPLTILPVPVFQKEIIQQQISRIIKLMEQCASYMKLSLDDMKTELVQNSMKIQVFDKNSVNIPKREVCQNLADIELHHLDELRNGTSKFIVFRIINAANVPLAFLACIIFPSKDSPDRLECDIDLLCANQKIPSFATRLLFAFILKVLIIMGVTKIELAATPEALSFYYSFGFKMENDDDDVTELSLDLTELVKPDAYSTKIRMLLPNKPMDIFT